MCSGLPLLWVQEIMEGGNITVMVGTVGVVLVAEVEDVEEGVLSGVEDEAMVLEDTMTMVSLMHPMSKVVVSLFFGTEFKVCCICSLLACC